MTKWLQFEDAISCMRILFLSTWFPHPLDNGSRIRVYHLLRALTHSHSVTMAAFTQVGSTDWATRVMAENDGLRIYPILDDPFRYVHVPGIMKHLSPIPLHYWPSQRMMQKVAQLATAHTWDAIVAIQMPVACYALQLRTAPALLDIDTSLSYQMYERYLKQVRPTGRVRSWISWKKADSYTSWIMRRFQVCTVASDRERPFVERMVRNRQCHVAVMPNGVDCQHNRPGLARAKPATLIFNGALTYSANYDAMQYFLASIYPLIKRDVPNVTLTITGSLKNVNVSGLSLDESVHLSGYIDDIRFPVAQSSVCIVPLRQGGGTRLKILEAMALGIPVVSTPKGAEGLDVTDGEHLLVAEDSKVFAYKTVQLLINDELRLGLAANARQLVEEEYDWSLIGRRFVSLIENLASPPGVHNSETRRLKS